MPSKTNTPPVVGSRPSSCSIVSGCLFPSRCKTADVCIYSLPSRQRRGHFIREDEVQGPPESV